MGLGAPPITALFATSLAMTGHEDCTAQHAGQEPPTWGLAAIAFPLFAGFSMSYWREKHNVSHHAHPNVNGVDPDINLWPMAFSRADLMSAHHAPSRVPKEPAGVVPMALDAVRGSQDAHGQSVVDDPTPIPLEIEASVQQDVVARFSAHDGSCGALVHHPHRLRGGLVHGHLLHVALWSIVGSLLVAIFIVGHTGLPIVESYESNQQLQYETGRSIRLGPIGRFFFIGLDRQIEHHLLPTVSHLNLQKVNSIVREYAEEKGWRYSEMGYWRAIWASTKFLLSSWQKAPKSLEELAEEARSIDTSSSGSPSR